MPRSQGNQIIQSDGSVWAGRGANIPDSYLCGRCQGDLSNPDVRSTASRQSGRAAYCQESQDCACAVRARSKSLTASMLNVTRARNPCLNAALLTVFIADRSGYQSWKLA